MAGHVSIQLLHNQHLHRFPRIYRNAPQYEGYRKAEWYDGTSTLSSSVHHIKCSILLMQVRNHGTQVQLDSSPLAALELNFLDQYATQNCVPRERNVGAALTCTPMPTHSDHCSDQLIPLQIHARIA